MKNYTLMIAATIALSACASKQPEYQAAPQQPVVQQPQHRPARACGIKAPVQQMPAAPVAQPCNTCGPHSYTVSEPVEVVYKNVTYTTVYEPKTYSDTTYVKKPYSCPNGNLCAQRAPAPMAPEHAK